MTIFGVDLHPSYQRGISLRRIRDEGFAFVIAKLSEGTNTASYVGSRAWLTEARSLGMHAAGYHYLRAGNIEAQADAFCAALRAAGDAPGMLDVEEGSGAIAGVRAFLDRCARNGRPVRMLYMPRWYWQQIGRPSLAGLPPLWSSRYPSMAQGIASDLYGRVPGSYWDGYGGGNVAVLQFSSSARVAGQVVDANAFEGTPAQLAALFGAAPAPGGPGRPTTPAPSTDAAARRHHQEDTQMYFETPEPAKDAAKADWPRIRRAYGFDPAGGWGGAGILRVNFGPRGGFVRLARWWIRNDDWTPNNRSRMRYWDHPLAEGGSEFAIAEDWQVPLVAGASSLELEVAAPDGVHIFTVYQR